MRLRLTYARVHGVQSPQKVPDTPNRPTSARASPLKESRLKPVPVKSFYTVATTKSFKDFDEDLILAPAFLVEKDGRLVRSDHVKLQEEQVPLRIGFVRHFRAHAGGLDHARWCNAPTPSAEA